MARPRLLSALCATMVCGTLLGCPDSSSRPAPSARAFAFGVRGLDDAAGGFVAVTSDGAVLARLEAELARPEAERTLHVHGALARGDGGHNLGWSWHFQPDGWDMVEFSIELCDGTPAMVEADLEYWLEELGEFCPWGSYVQQELEAGTP